MSLQSKFGVIFVMLGITVLGSLSAAIWTFTIQHRALTGPFESTPRVLASLQEVRRNLELQIAAVRCLDNPAEFMAQAAHEDPASLTPASGPLDKASVLHAANKQFTKLHEASMRHMKLVTDSDLYIAGRSQSALKILNVRLDDFKRAGAGWFLLQDASTKAVLIQAAADTSDFVERFERKLLEDRGRGIDFSNGIVGTLLWVLGWAAFAAGLIAVLALMLVRRWVVRPVQNLRLAAVDISHGNFDNKIPIRGKDEIAQLGVEVNSMASMVKDMLEERVERERLAAVGEMVKRLAHNLRSPLAGIRGVAEISRDDLPPGSEPRQNQERILVAVDRLEKWMADLLSATKPLQIHTEPVNPKHLLSQVIDSQRSLAFSKGITVELDTSAAPGSVMLDPMQMEHALVCIVSNAIQASPPNSRVLTSARLLEQRGMWEIRVSDQGPGVPPELTEKIFQPYFTTKRDGNGIGLAVALQVVKGHQGRITTEPGLGHSTVTGTGIGVTFVVTLPLNTSTTTAPAHESPIARSPDGAPIAQNFGHRGRREPAVLDSPNTG